MTTFKTKSNHKLSLIAAFIIFTAITIAVGYYYYRYAANNYKEHFSERLSTIADFNVLEIERSRKQGRS